MHEPFKFPEFKTLDDLLKSTYEYILNSGSQISGKRGNIKEAFNFAVTLTNCRSRISRSLDRRLVKSKFAEFAWYLSGDADRDYIKPYISAYNDEDSENNKILGGYGPKIFNSDDNNASQFERIYEQIVKRKDTKQAYLAISSQSDYKVRTDKYSSPPCTIGLHFTVRNSLLNLTTYMRSNDAYFGLPHDLFCFTMLQELMSCRTNIPAGSYTHICTSMHIYEQHFERVKNYLKEGFHEGIFMPSMKNCDEESLQVVVDSFGSTKDSMDGSILDSYWNDFCLFANRFTREMDKELWLNLFRTDEFKDIADCSITG